MSRGQYRVSIHWWRSPPVFNWWPFSKGSASDRTCEHFSNPFVWNYSHTQTHPGNSVPHLQPQVQLPLQSISPSVATLYFLDLWAANTFFWSDRTSGFQQPRTASLKPHTIVNLGWAVTSSELGLHHKVHSETPRLSAGSKLFSKHLLVLLCCLKQLK